MAASNVYVTKLYSILVIKSNFFIKMILWIKSLRKKPPKNLCGNISTSSLLLEKLRKESYIYILLFHKSF